MLEYGRNIGGRVPVESSAEVKTKFLLKDSSRTTVTTDVMGEVLLEERTLRKPFEISITLNLHKCFSSFIDLEAIKSSWWPSLQSTK